MKFGYQWYVLMNLFGRLDVTIRGSHLCPTYTLTFQVIGTLLRLDDKCPDVG